MADLKNISGNVPRLSMSNSSSVVDGGAGTTNKELMRAAREALSGNWLKVLTGTFVYMLLYLSASLLATVVGALVGGAPYRSLFSGASETAVAGNLWVSISLGVAGMLMSCFFMFGWFNFFRVLAEDSEVQLEAFFAGGRKLLSTMGAFLLLYGLYLVFLLACFALMLFVLNSNFITMIAGLLVMNFLPIYLFLRYSMVFFLLTDGDEYGAFGALGRSSEIMDGFKWKLFCLFFRLWLLLLLFVLPLLFSALFAPLLVTNYGLSENLPLFVSLGAGVWFVIGMIWYVPFFMTAFAKFYDDVK